MLEYGTTVTCTKPGYRREFLQGTDYVIERVELPPRDGYWYRLRSPAAQDAQWISHEYLCDHFTPKSRCLTRQSTFPACRTPSRRLQRSDLLSSVHRRVAMRSAYQRGALVQYAEH